jgi:hypothetical protein
MHRGFDLLQNSEGETIGKFASILLAPLGQEPGGLCLSDNTVERLSEIKVPTSQWYDNNHFDVDPKGPKVAIDNGFRLIRHYCPKEMSFIPKAELDAIGKIFSSYLK